MNDVDKIYDDYNNKLLIKWTKEILSLKCDIMNNNLSEIKKAYIRGQIKALEEICERFKNEFS